MASSSAGSGGGNCQICDSRVGGIDPSQCECCGFGSCDWNKLAQANFTVEDQIACVYILKGCNGIVCSDLGAVAMVCALKKVLCKSKSRFIKLRIADTMGSGKNKGKGKNKVVDRASKGKGTNKVVDRASRKGKKGKNKVVDRASKGKKSKKSKKGKKSKKSKKCFEGQEQGGGPDKKGKKSKKCFEGQEGQEQGGGPGKKGKKSKKGSKSKG
jgi:hypothetical protein